MVGDGGLRQVPAIGLDFKLRQYRGQAGLHRRCRAELFSGHS
jgi:hypothetical protein